MTTAPYFKADLKPDYIERGSDGQIYPIHPPGVSVLVLPAFAVAGYPGAVATMIAWTALASALTWHTAWLLAESVAGAWFGWAAVFLTVPFFFHTFTIYPDGGGALLVVTGIALLVRLETRRDVSDRWLALAGLALGALPWFHTRFAVIAGCIGLVIAMRLLAGPRRWIRLAVFAAVPAVSAAAWFGYFWYFWGTPNPAAPYGAATNTAVSLMGRGMTGLLIDQQFGLIANAPVYAVAVLGCATLWRTHRRLLIELALITMPYFAATSSYGMWWGGLSAPARFIAALMPIAALPMACWWRARGETAWRAFAMALWLLSALAILPRLLVSYGSLMYNARDGFDLLLEWASRTVDLPMGFPAVHRGATGTALIEAAIWVVAGLALAAAAWGLATRAARASVGAVWTATALAGAVCAMAAITAVWSVEGITGLTSNRAEVDLLDHWRPGWQTTTLRLRPLPAAHGRGVCPPD